MVECRLRHIDVGYSPRMVERRIDWPRPILVVQGVKTVVLDLVMTWYWMTTRQFATSGLDLGLVLERRFKDNWYGAKRLVLNQELKLGAWESLAGGLYTWGSHGCVLGTQPTIVQGITGYESQWVQTSQREGKVTHEKQSGLSMWEQSESCRVIDESPLHNKDKEQ